MSFFRRNFAYKCLSLIIAILLYWIASGSQNPHVTRDFFVQPEVQDLPANLVLKSPPQGTTISVSGPSSAVDTFKTETRKAVIDLSHAQPGPGVYPIQYLIPSGYATSLDVVGPLQTSLTLERRVSHEFAVDVLFDNTPPAGYAYTDPVSTPKLVAVEGSASDVARVDRVAAIVNNTGNPGAITTDVQLVPQDAKLQTVDGVTLVPKQVHVTIKLKRAPATKSVILSADLNGTPAPGYIISGYRFWPSTMTVSGPADLLNARSSLSVPIDVDGIHADTTRTLIVQPPAGLTIVGGRSAVRLHLDVKPVALPAPSSAPVQPASQPGGGDQIASPAPGPLPAAQP